MSYRFEDLGSAEFEHLVQALLLKLYGPTVGVFGSGRDSGRDATFEGRAVPADDAEREATPWDGYHVFQAKFHERPTTTDADRRWMLSQITKELDAWVAPATKREGPRPEYIVFVTNVALSGVVGGGLDQAKRVIRKKAQGAGWTLKDCAVWDRAKVSRLLDGATDVRRKFAGLITIGDVLAAVSDERSKSGDHSLAAALPMLEEHARGELLSSGKVSLGEAGQTASQKFDLAKVAIDLPARYEDDPDPEAAFNVLERILSTGDRVHRPSVDGAADSRFLLMGGPGQGKTTLGRLLVQIYRASLLVDVPNLPGNVRAAVNDTLARASVLGLSRPVHRRWPFRIDLAEYAEKTAGRNAPLVGYVAAQVSAATGEAFLGRDMRKWLAAWPWLIVLDGYDEVAVESAREHVARAVEGLLQAAHTEDADLLVVATTRPQGYGDELPLSLRKLRLTDLPPQTAIAYASRIIELRLGDDVEKAAVIQRTADAVGNEVTGRLMRTPLQVMIMSLLLERRRKPPQDRADLFGSYYDVVYDREMQKNNYLAGILRQYRSDVDAIHSLVGLRLQMVSEDALLRDAALSREELASIVRGRLIDQEHQEPELGRLTNDLLRASQDRLVLLEARGKDEVGFELRSLQEFMAARFLANGSDDDVVERLRVTGRSAHWRNTWLLAVGTVYRNRASLFERVLYMLRQLDAEDALSLIVKTGPRLAIDVLEDGMAASSPKHLRLLTEHALEILEGPNLHAGALGEVLAEVAAINTTLQAAALQALQRAWDGPPSAHQAARIVLGILAGKDRVGPLATRARQMRSSAPKVQQPIGPGRPGDRVRLADALPGAAQNWPSDTVAGAFLGTLRRLHTVIGDDGAIGSPDPLAFANTATTVVQDDDALLQVAGALEGIAPINWAAKASIAAMLWNARQRLPVAAELKVQ